MSHNALNDSVEVPSVSIKIYVKSRLEYSTELTSSLQLGRQQTDEAAPFTRIGDRVVIAELAEKDISREHLLLELLADGTIRVTNLSKVNTVLIGADQVLPPVESRAVSVGTLLTLFGRVIQLVGKRSASETGIFESFSHKTTPPGGAPSTVSSIVDVLASRRSTRDNEFLLRGLHVVTSLFQLTTNPSEFFPLAAQAMVNVVELENAAALEWTGTEWRVLSFSARSGAKSPPPGWEPSRSILQNVRDEKRTFWRVPDVKAGQVPSLVDVQAVVATPILDREGEIIGALYGDRRRSVSGEFALGISEVEAVLVELLTSSVAAGLARVEQELAAVRARVLFEQFFTAELARELETHPDLLLGKDMEVTLMFCDIRGLSHVSERLGPRLTIDWINDVMGSLSGCVAEQHGVVLDTLGDGFSAMWGAPVERPDHADMACQSALQILEQLPALNRRWQNAIDRPLDVGIGIHTGVARVGNIGSERKFQYGPLGKTVDVARRAQQATGPLKTSVLITGATAATTKSDYPVRRLCRVDVDPLGAQLDLLELVQHAPDDWPALKQRYESALESFERQDLPTATRLLAKILSEHPNDRAALRLLAQINDSLSPSGWSF